MSGSASIVWTLPFTSRVIRAMGACLPWGCREATDELSRIGRCASLAIADGFRLTRLVQGAGIGNSLTQLCCGGVPAPAAQELAVGPTPNRRPTRAPRPRGRAPAFPKYRG